MTAGGSLTRPATERQPLRTLVAASAERQRCEISAVPLTRRRVLVVVLNLAGGIARFRNCVVESSRASESLRTLECALDRF